MEGNRPRLADPDGRCPAEDGAAVTTNCWLSMRSSWRPTTGFGPGVASHPTTIGNADMRKFVPAKKRIEVTPGESVRIIRGLQGLSQTRLSARLAHRRSGLRRFLFF
jgi:hypothetical protein